VASRVPTRLESQVPAARARRADPPVPQCDEPVPHGTADEPHLVIEVCRKYRGSTVLMMRSKVVDHLFGAEVFDNRGQSQPARFAHETRERHARSRPKTPHLSPHSGDLQGRTQTSPRLPRNLRLVEHAAGCSPDSGRRNLATGSRENAKSGWPPWGGSSSRGCRGGAPS